MAELTPAPAGGGSTAAGTATVDTPGRSVGLGARIHDTLHDKATLGPAIVLLIALIGFSLFTDRFLAANNLSLVLQQVMVVGTPGHRSDADHPHRGHRPFGRGDHGPVLDRHGQAVGRLGRAGRAGPADRLRGGHALRAHQRDPRLPRPAPPFIVTLGTLNIFIALNLYYSQSETIRGTDMSDVLLYTGNTFAIGDTRIAYGVLLMLALFGLVAYALRATAWGRHVYATGDDREAARLAGVQTTRVLLSVYTVAGLLCAVAGWILIGRIASASPQAGGSANLDSITAVVIGGTSLFGGRGLVIGTLFGALIVGVLRNGLALAGVDVLWQDFAVGFLVLTAVAIDQWIRKVKA